MGSKKKEKKQKEVEQQDTTCNIYAKDTAEAKDMAAKLKEAEISCKITNLYLNKCGETPSQINAISTEDSGQKRGKKVSYKDLKKL